MAGRPESLSFFSRLRGLTPTFAFAVAVSLAFGSTESLAADDTDFDDGAEDRSDTRERIPRGEVDETVRNLEYEDCSASDGPHRIKLIQRFHPRTEKFSSEWRVEAIICKNDCGLYVPVGFN